MFEILRNSGKAGRQSKNNIRVTVVGFPCLSVIVINRASLHVIEAQNAACQHVAYADGPVVIVLIHVIA